MEKYFNSCEAAAPCKQAYPNLKHRFIKAMIDLKNEPRHVLVPVENRPGKIFSLVDAQTLLAGLRSDMLVRDNLTLIPFYLDSIATGVEGALASAIKDDINIGFANWDNYGAFHISNCFDHPEERLSLSEHLDKGEFMLMENIELRNLGIDDCNKLGESRARSEDRQPLVSSIPTLILAGEFDPATPPWLSKLAARGLQNSHLFIFPFESHSLSDQNGCAKQLVWSFLKNLRCDQTQIV